MLGRDCIVGVAAATVAFAACQAVDEAAPPSAATWHATYVFDGDTLEVTGEGDEWKVRLIGIDTPERGECFADEARDELRALTDRQDLVLVVDVSDTDRFDRKLRYVETADGLDVGAELVHKGFARSVRYRPDTARNDRYDWLQREAETVGAGLWALDAC